MVVVTSGEVGFAACSFVSSLLFAVGSHCWGAKLIMLL